MRKYPLPIIVVLSMLGSSVVCFAQGDQEKKIVTFEEAVNIALDKSYDVQRARVDLLLAKADQLQTYANVGPTFNLSYAGQTNREELSRTIGGQEVLVQPLSTTNISVAIGMNLTRVIAGLLKIWSDSTNVHVSETAKEQVRIETAFGVARVYRIAQQAKLALDVAQSRLKTVEKQKRDAVSLFAYGKISKAEKLQIDFNANNSQIGVINAQNEWLTSQETLKKILHIDSELELVLDEMKDIKQTEIPQAPEKTDSVVMALQERTDLRVSKLTLDSISTGAWLTLSSYLPDINFRTHWTWSGSSVSEFSLANTQFVTLNATWKFWDNGSALLDFRKGNLSTRRARINLREKEVDVRIDVEKSLRNFALAKQTFEARKTGLEQAEEAYRGVDARFALGAISVTDLLFNEGILNQAKLDHLAATVGLDIAFMNLQKAMGKKRPVPL